MGTQFIYGLILTVAGAIFNLLMYFTGFHTEKLATGQHLNWLMLPVNLVILFFGIRAVREARPDKSLSYGQGVGAGAMISLYWGIFGAIFSFVYFKYINPGFFDYQLEMMRQQWAQKGIPDAQIEQMASGMQKFSGPITASIATLLLTPVIGTVCSLVLAIFAKRTAAVQPPPLAA